MRAWLTALLIGFACGGGSASAEPSPASFPDFSKGPCHPPGFRPEEYIDQHLIYFKRELQMHDPAYAAVVLDSAAC